MWFRDFSYILQSSSSAPFSVLLRGSIKKEKSEPKRLSIPLQTYQHHTRWLFLNIFSLALLSRSFHVLAVVLLFYSESVTRPLLMFNHFSARSPRKPFFVPLTQLIFAINFFSNTFFPSAQDNGESHLDICLDVNTEWDGSQLQNMKREA